MHKLRKTFSCQYEVKRSVTEQIQEGLECIQEIKSYNGEDEYNRQFNSKLRAYEKELINGELVAGLFCKHISNATTIGNAFLLFFWEHG